MAERVRDRVQQSNVTPETFHEHFDIIASSKGRIDTAQSEHRNAVKAAKAVGIDTAALLQVLKESRWDDDKRKSRFKSLDTYRKWMTTKPGTQWELDTSSVELSAHAAA